MTLSDLSGYVTFLSGKVDVLETNYTYVLQQLLQTTDLTDFSQYRVTWNTQQQQAAAAISRLQGQVSVLQNLLVNLNITLTDRYNEFNTHTGLPAISGHRGLT